MTDRYHVDRPSIGVLSIDDDLFDSRIKIDSDNYMDGTVSISITAESGISDDGGYSFPRDTLLIDVGPSQVKEIVEFLSGLLKTVEVE